MPRLWARAAPRASSRSSPCSQSRSRRLWNVLNTSWLAKPSRSRARGPILGHERAGGREVLPLHDLGRLDLAVRPAGVAVPQPSEGLLEVGELLGRVAGLAQLVAARVAEGLDALAQAGVGVVAQPCRGLHDVRVGVVDHQPGRVVGHGRKSAIGMSGAPGGRSGRAVRSDFFGEGTVRRG